MVFELTGNTAHELPAAHALRSCLTFQSSRPKTREFSTPPAMPDATVHLSELLSAVRGRRTQDDPVGLLRREPSSKTLLCTTNSRSYFSPNSLLKASDGSSTASDPDGEESLDLPASMRLVRAYAARVKKMPPSPETTPFGAFPPFPAPQGGSFLNRGRGGFFRRESLHRLSSPTVSRERSSERSRSILRAKYFSPEQAPSGSNVPFKAASALVETRIIEGDGPPPLRRAEFISSGLQVYPPAAASQRRLPAPPPESGDAVSANAATAAAPVSRHVSIQRRRWASTSDLSALPPAPSSSKRFHVRGGERLSAQLTEVVFFLLERQRRFVGCVRASGDIGPSATSHGRVHVLAMVVE
ncbi:hypothetical protein T484DRAFT_1740638 [Baffinella frigidus]|nr:hypothetical protein T484DRAFT_1740638 [Cryptophyta sp. CCMP2293]